jgi:3',5'-cyclic AMP phosphodiesterase CpdA
VNAIAHLSDLHFGTEDPALVRRLLVELGELQPRLTVISGDLTQRARRAQFAAARRFVDVLPAPVLVVPGNHDIPLWDVTRRIFSPLGRYLSYITPDLCPFHRDGELAVLGLNTTRPARWKEGEISPAQADLIRARLGGLEDGLVKVVVTHHPFIPPPDQPRLAVVGGRATALAALRDAGVDLLLSGHLHLGYSGLLDERPGLLSVQASTAVSRRRRGQPNGYNVIHLAAAGGPVLETRRWDGRAFRPVTVPTLRHSPR